MCSDCAFVYGMPDDADLTTWREYVQPVTQEMLDTAGLIRRWYRLYPEFGTGGPLHPMLDDENVSDSQIAHYPPVENLAFWRLYEEFQTPESKDLARAIVTSLSGMPYGQRLATTNHAGAYSHNDRPDFDW